MSKFKVGDKVRCLNSNDFYHLFINRAYRIIETNGDLVQVRGHQNNGDGGWCTDRFEKVRSNGRK